MTPQWICEKCQRPLDDHQLRDYVTLQWLPAPRCVKEGLIAKGIRLHG